MFLAVPRRLILIFAVGALSLAITGVAIGRIGTQPPKPPNGHWTLESGLGNATGFNLKRGKHKNKKYQFASHIHAVSRASVYCPEPGTPLKVLGKFRLRVIGRKDSNSATWAVGKADPQAQGGIGTIPAKVKVQGQDAVSGKLKIAFSQLSPKETWVNVIEIPGATSDQTCTLAYSDGGFVHK